MSSLPLCYYVVVCSSTMPRVIIFLQDELVSSLKLWLNNWLKDLIPINYKSHLSILVGRNFVESKSFKVKSYSCLGIGTFKILLIFAVKSLLNAVFAVSFS